MNLDAARAVVERELVDTCRVTRDSGVDDDTFDTATGEYVPDLATTLHEGVCAVLPGGESRAPRPGTGPADSTAARYVLLLPLAAPELRAGDEVEILTSLRDPQAVGRVLRVGDVPPVGTFAVVRRVYCDAK